MSFFAFDWARVHDFELGACVRKLKTGYIARAPFRSDIASASIEPDYATDVVYAAFSHGLPKEIIEKLQEVVLLKIEYAEPSKRSSFTYFPEDAEGPAIVCRLTGNASHDLMLIAHELGHALQLYLAGRGFIPPIDREIAAFLGEHLLLGYAETELPNLFDDLLNFHTENRQKQLGRRLDDLIEAIETPGSQYHYWWNYPPAFQCAEAIADRGDTGEMLGYFQHKVGLGAWLAETIRNPAKVRPLDGLRPESRSIGHADLSDQRCSSTCTGHCPRREVGDRQGSAASSEHLRCTA